MVIYGCCAITLQCLVVAKRSHIFKQTGSFQLQVCLNMCDLFVTTRHYKFKVKLLSYCFSFFSRFLIKLTIPSCLLLHSSLMDSPHGILFPSISKQFLFHQQQPQNKELLHCIAYICCERRLALQVVTGCLHTKGLLKLWVILITIM